MIDVSKDNCGKVEVRLSITPEEDVISGRGPTEEENELRTDWNTRCCCTSRVKFSDTAPQSSSINEVENSSGAHLIDEIANVISDYRRESVLNTISEFEKKLLMVGMAGEFNLDGSDSEESGEEDSRLRRHSEFSQRPLAFSVVENRRATAPSNISTTIIDQLAIKVNEDNTEELKPDSNTESIP
ncbi:hypothetical protein OIY81_3176 [Cryptosporidium canis]|nr:hypothetical protein OIY81_3176 [Cryptosporidium canis]